MTDHVSLACLLSSELWAICLPLPSALVFWWGKMWLLTHWAKPASSSAGSPWSVLCWSCEGWILTHLEAQGFLMLPDFFKHIDKKAQQQELSELEPMELSMAFSPSVVAVEDNSDGYNPENEGEEVWASVAAREEEEGSTTCTTTLWTCQSSGSDSSGLDSTYWGTSWMILYQGNKSSSSSNTSSNSEDLQGTDSQELMGNHCRHAPDNLAPQPPIDSTLKLLQDHEEPQAIQRELSLVA